MIYKEELENILTQYLQGTGINKREANDLTDLIIKQLRYRNFILCSLGGNAFAFVHRTFLEYFCACEFYERFKKRGLPDGINLEELKSKVFGEHYSDPVWKEVLCLLMGMLSAEFPKEIAEELISYLIDMEEQDQEFAHLFLAADCYGELRNQCIYVELSQRLLNKLEMLYNKDISYYKKYDPEKWWQQRDKIRNKNISSLVRNWQGDPKGWNALQKMAQSASWREEEPIINALVKIAQLYPQALSKIQELANSGKSKAIEGLVTHWQDNPQTLPIIQQQANKGEYKAIELLAIRWRDNDETLPIIQQQANKGEPKAIQALAVLWRDNNETLLIIQQLANKGESQAIEALATYWQDHPETLPIIQQLANQGESEAIEALVTYWPDNPKTLLIIQQLFYEDESKAIFDNKLRRLKPKLARLKPKHSWF